MASAGGIFERVVERRVGFLVLGECARAMAERILDVLADKGLWLKMGGRPWNGKATFSSSGNVKECAYPGQVARIQSNAT